MLNFYYFIIVKAFKMKMQLLALITIVSAFVLLPFCTANTECAWATGLIKCNKNQTKVLGAVVELWDLDSPQNTNFQNPLDTDDKAAFTEVEDPTGLWKLEGCASDHDWLSINRPEFYLRVYHNCNTDIGEWLTVWPVFRVYTPRTYDWHIEHPIVLDAPVPNVTGMATGSILNKETSSAPFSTAANGGEIVSSPYNNVDNNKGAEIDPDIVSDGTQGSKVK